MKKILLPLLALLLLTNSLLTADDVPAKAAFQHEIKRTTRDIVLDGVVNEEEWKDALRLSIDYEVRPGENVAPPVDQWVYLTYDDNYLYAGFVCNDPRPEEIRARYTDRDACYGDDFVCIVIDTFNDQRRAFEFLCNPLGVQADMIMDDTTGNEDDSWNAIWDSIGTIRNDGFHVEMAIPFNQIRFQDVEGKQIWGIDAIRRYPRSDNFHIGLFPRVRGKNSYLSQTVKIQGFENVEPGRNFEVVPTLTSFRSEEKPDFPDGEMQGSESKTDAGITARWGVTPNIMLSGTINPDFSQVEADSVQLGINETFDLYFRETRPFFLEGADYFDLSWMNLVHTRTIADPATAIKVTGKEGNHTFGIFTAEDEVTNIIIPGSEGSDSATFGMNNSSTVARYRYDMGSNSTIGMMMTNRQGNNYYNRVFALDSTYRFTENDQLLINIAGSATQYNEDMVKEFGVTSDEITDRALIAQYRHSERNYSYFARYEDYGSDYRADLGFEPQVNFKKLVVGGQKEWWGDSKDFFRRLTLTADYDQTQDQAGHLMEREFEGYVMGNGPMQSFFLFGGGIRDRVYEQVTFDQFWVQAQLEFRPHPDLFSTTWALRGKWIDFEHVREADRILLEQNFNYRFGKHLQLNLHYNYTLLDVEGGKLFDAHVPELKVIYQFGTRMFIRGIFQYVNISRNLEMYEDPDTEAKTESLLTQFLFSYKINPQTVLYLGYGDTYRGTSSYDLTQNSRTVFMKLGYAWSL